MSMGTRSMSDHPRNKDPDQSSAGGPRDVSVGISVGSEHITAVQTSSHINVTTFFAPIVERASLLLQAVIIPGSKTAEGTLIKAVAAPWYDIIALLKDNPGIAFQIPPDKWEEILAAAYKRSGFEEVTLTPRSGDHGRDVIAIKRESPGGPWIGTVRIIDQVKAFNPRHLVTANDVRALMGVLQADHAASKGIVTTTSDFAPRVRDDPYIAPLIPYRLELINGPELFGRLRALTEGKS
jgi:restriction system protein